jgi:DNA-binding NtrC family response regulator
MTYLNHVLVVEDDDVLRGLICDVLTDIGAHPVAAATADEGRALFAEPGRQWDLVLTDLTTPGQSSGHDLAWDAFSVAPPIPVLVCSGYLGANPHPLPPSAQVLSKPWLLETFEARITHLLQK